MSLGELEWRRRRLDEAGALYRDALGRAMKADDRASVAGIRVALALVGRDRGGATRRRRRPPRPSRSRRRLAHRPLEAEALAARAAVARAKR